MQRIIFPLVLLLLLSEVVSSTFASEYRPGVVNIKFTKEMGDIDIVIVNGVPSVGVDEIDRISESYEVYKVEKLFFNEEPPDNPDFVDLSRWYVFHFPEKYQPQEVVNAFTGNEYIEIAECDWLNYPDYIPNDPMYSSCWALEQVQADSAWNISRGNQWVTISIVDSGIDTGHVDLRDKFYINFGEDVNGDSLIDLWDYNNIDDDNNGYIDDFWGWDFIGWDNSPMPEDPSQDHGTLCASCAAAATDNGEGVASTGFNTRLMNIRSTLFSNALANAINYSADNGADIVSASWGSIAPSSLIQDAVQHCHDLGVMFVTSAGNDDNYTPPWSAYPSLFPHVLSVGSTNQNDQLSYFSNYCITPWDGIIDVCAPGESILSAALGGGYETWQGTSASCPTVAGIAALIMSVAPELTPAEVESTIVHTCDDIYPQNPGFAYGILGHGRVNAFKALLEVSHYLILDDMIIDDNGNNDGRADPGETVDVVVTLLDDERSQPASGIIGTLVCEDEAVSITSSTASFGTIIPGFTASNSGSPFQFTVGVTEPHFTEFTLLLTDDQGMVQQIDFDLELGRPDYLLIDDDGGEFYESFYQSSFEIIDTFVDVWNTQTGDITADELNRYNYIIWETGSERSTLSANERTALQQFFDNGGNLLLSSQNAGADIGTTPFYSDYLHASFVADTVVGAFKMFGVDGCPFTSSADTLFFVGGTGAGNFQSCDAIEPVGGAGIVFDYFNSDYTGGIYYNGSFSVVYLAFPLESVTGLANTVPRDVVIANIFDWFTSTNINEFSKGSQPAGFALYPNYPNPFNPETLLRFNLPKAGYTNLTVYDLNGRQIVNLIDGIQTAGYHEITFGASTLASGIYFARLKTEDVILTQKVVLLK